MKDEGLRLPQRTSLPHFAGIEWPNVSVIHFVTVCTKERRPLLASKMVHGLLRKAWSPVDFFQVGRYVIMPDHLHLFCAPILPNAGYLKAWVTFWKSYVSKNWQRERPAQLWQRDFWDTQLRRGENFEMQWDYIRMNPVRKGLVKKPNDWPYQGEMNPLKWD